MPRAPSLNAKNLSNVLMPVVNWKQLGINLDIKRYKLNEIEKNYSGDTAGARLALIDLWLRSDINASWEKLIAALKEMDEVEVIERIQADFLQGGAAVGTRGARQQVPVDVGGAQRNFQASRIVSDGGGPNLLPGIRQPVRGEELAPQEELRHAQLMIDHPDDQDPEGKVVKMISNFANWSLDIDHRNPDDFDNTLLHYSCVRGDLSSLRAIVAFGADVNRRNKNGQTPLEIAQFMHKADMVKFLKEVGGMEGNTLKFVNSPCQPPIQERDHNMEGEDGVREDDMPGGHLILSLDYSSTMALVQLEVLNQLEKATGKRIVDMFEWIVASGVSGFLMMAMVYAKKTVSELRRIYFRLRERVFSGQAPQERGKQLEDFAVEIFGSRMRMADVAGNVEDDYQGPRLLIGAINKASTNLDPVFFNNYQESTVHVWKVARYTCSSPLYVGECDDYIDGGVVCKNPSIFAFSMIRDAYQMQSVRLSGFLSIGDGKMPGLALGKLDQSNYYSHFHMSTANTLSEEVSRSFSAICEAGGLAYQRINPLMDEYITVPEEATLEQLISAVIHTITQAGDEGSEVQVFKRKFNNS